jgi:transketolase
MLGERIATRDAFSKALVEFGVDNDRVVALDADLAHATMSCKFQEAAPERFFNVGISECDMIGTAAGLATTGKIPFACSFAMFTAGRAFEQIRNSVAYPKLNVKICGSHGGLSVGKDGATHQATEDLALMATIPNMVVINPCDAVEMRAAIKALIAYDGPAYIRLGRNMVPVVLDETDYEFKIGKGVKIRAGSDVTLIASGTMLDVAMKSAIELEKQGIYAEIINIATIKPLDKEIIIESAKRTGRIVVMEEGILAGGLGSAVATAMSEVHPVPMRFIGVDDRFGQSGDADDLFVIYGLSVENTIGKVRELLS